jgi:hypothetical protein
MNDQNDPGYDQTMDPRTGRPPLAAEAERMRAAQNRQPEADEAGKITTEPDANRDAASEDQRGALLASEPHPVEHEIPIEDPDEEVEADDATEEAELTEIGPAEDSTADEQR